MIHDGVSNQDSFQIDVSCVFLSIVVNDPNCEIWYVFACIALARDVKISCRKLRSYTMNKILNGYKAIISGLLISVDDIGVGIGRESNSSW